MTGADVRRVRERLNLDHATMAKLLGVSLRKMFYLEANGTESGPTWLVLDIAAHDELPARYIPRVNTKGRLIPIEEG